MSTRKRIVGFTIIALAWASYFVLVMPSAIKLNDSGFFVFTGFIAILMVFATVEVALELLHNDPPLPPRRRRTDQPPEYND